MVREVEEWSGIHIRDEITTKVGHSALPTDRPTHDIKFTEIGCNLAVGQTDTQTNSIKKHNLPKLNWQRQQTWASKTEISQPVTKLMRGRQADRQTDRQTKKAPCSSLATPVQGQCKQRQQAVSMATESTGCYSNWAADQSEQEM